MNPIQFSYVLTFFVGMWASWFIREMYTTHQEVKAVERKELILQLKKELSTNKGNTRGKE